MAKKSSDDGDRNSGRANYAPEWITKSIDKVPPSQEPLAPNAVFEQLVALGRENGKQGTQNGDSNAPHQPDENASLERS